MFTSLLFRDIVASDWNIEAEVQAEKTIRQALQQLIDMGGEYDWQKFCPV
jgi:hypothetical protein